MTAPLRKENAAAPEGTDGVASERASAPNAYPNGSYPRPMGATPDVLDRVRQMEGYDARREFYTGEDIDALFDGEDAPVWRLGDEDDGEPRDRVEVPL